MEMRNSIMVRIPNKDGEEEVRIMNPDSSAGIYITASLEAQCILIAQKRKKKDEEKIKNTKANALKRTARMNQLSTSFAKPVSNLLNDMMDSEENSTPLLQVFLSL